jgi:hypothetical protein
LKKVITDAKINTTGSIFYKSIQIFAYADDIDIVGQSQAAMNGVFINLEKAITFNPYIFEAVHSFITEIKKRSLSACRSFHGLRKHF